MTFTGIDVRPIKIHDLLRLRPMQTDLLTPDQSMGRLSQHIADPWSALPVSRRVRKSFVAFMDGYPAGLIDLTADPANHRWVVSRIATCQGLTRENAEARDAVWRELAIEAIRSAGAARAKRIHVVAPEPSDVIPALISTGFTEYAQDSILTAQRLPSERRAGVARRQESSDVWSIHQLYHSVTPRPVQYAEALTSNFWDGALPGQAPARGYVIEDGYEIVAHCRIAPIASCPVMHVMVHPDARELLEPMVADVVLDITRGSSSRVSIVVPDYLQEYLNPLHNLGFEEVGRQTRMVKHTVVPRRAQFRSVEELAKEVPERVAAGTPTFYYAGGTRGTDENGHSADGKRETDGFS